MTARGFGRAALAAGAFLAACDGATDLPVVASVAVTSALDTLLAPGASSQLAAVARDGGGNAVGGVAYAWSSTDASVVTVSDAGLVTAQATGSARVTVGVEGTGVTGGLPFRVVDADLPGIAALSGDAFAAALLAALSPAMRSDALSAWAGCGSGAGSGHLVLIIGCVEDVRAAAAAAADGTDRALLAVARLYADEIERRLGL